MGSEVDIIARNIARLIREFDITQAILASAIGVSESAVGKWILGHNPPTMGNIQKIADYFGVLKSAIYEEHSNDDNNVNYNYLMRQLTHADEEELTELRLYWDGVIRKRNQSRRD